MLLCVLGIVAISLCFVLFFAYLQTIDEAKFWMYMDAETLDYMENFLMVEEYGRYLCHRKTFIKKIKRRLKNEKTEHLKFWR